MSDTLKHAVILAGGKGTRMRDVHNDIPKPMIPVAGKPLLQYQIEMCAAQGIERVTLLVNHLKESIVMHFGDGSQFGLVIDYFEEEQPLGTVGGVKAVEDRIEGDFLILYGDVMMEMDLARLYRFHCEKEAEATLVVHPNDHPHDSDLVDFDREGRITAVYPKPHPGNFVYHNAVNAAAYVFSPSVFKHLKKGVKADFGRDVFPVWVDKVKMYAYQTPEYLKDMGTPDRLGKVEKDVLNGKVKRRSLVHEQRCVFLDRDGVLNEDIDLIHKAEDLKIYPFVPEAIAKLNASDYLSVVVTNQSVVARGLTDEAGLNDIHKKLETELGKQGAFLDAIYYCPHHPDKGFSGERPEYKIDCACRKPKPGMLLDAAKRFNINLRKSFLIGDSDRDIQAGKSAGVRTIAVRTGSGNVRQTARPDFHFDDLSDAVDFILSDALNAPYLKLRKMISCTKEYPLIVGVGGQARSGKSTFVSEMIYRLNRDGVQTMRLPLDQWIVPVEQREGKEAVQKTYRLERMKRDLKAFFAKETIQIPGYSDHPDRPSFSFPARWSGESVIFVEGVPALIDREMAGLYHWKVFVQVGEEVRRKRFEKFYRWKGRDEGWIEECYNHRLATEYEIIRQGITFADDTVYT